VPKRSAGILVFRRTKSGLEVLLAHPGGPFWARKDDGAWTIPKGELAEGEDPLEGAKREFGEETGFDVTGEPVALEPVRQAGGKVVLAWAVEQAVDPAGFTSNTFSMEWPPRSGKRAEFPEVDRLEWFTVDTARRKILSGQLGLVEEAVRRFG
jgi:predicted NUDIX family NTP pyrophosphohydrolase